jgi:transcriptional regulator with XRE-family HTH domain
MPRRPPPPHGLTLTILRLSKGWSQKDLAEGTGLSRSLISEYETGTTELTRDRLEMLAAATGWPPGSVDRVLFGLGLMQPSPDAPVSPVDLDVEERRIIDQAVAVGAREVAEAVRAQLIGERRQEKVQQARQNAEALWLRLKPLSPAERRAHVAREPEYHDPFLCERLCAESERAAASDAGRAQDLAELALFVAERVPGLPGWRSRLKGYAWAFIGNARRVGNDLPAADKAFARAKPLWKEGAPADFGLLDEALVLDLEASLRRDQRQFVEALKLHDQAFAFARPEKAGYILINKAKVLEELEDFEGALATLQQAVPLIEKQREPRMFFILRFNRAVNLLQLDRLSEAEALLGEAREVAVRLGNELDLVRVLWLDARVALGCGNQRKAIEIFEQVRQEFAAREMAYDFALVSLELAVLYREQDRTGEVKALAQQMVWIFKAQGIHREALAALELFREAAEKENLTVDMARRLVDYLTKARHDPQLRFEA